MPLQLGALVRRESLLGSYIKEDIAGDRMKQFFPIGTAFTAATPVLHFIPGGALVGAITNIITGPFWNWWDSWYGAQAANNDLTAAAKSKNRKQSKHFFATANQFWSKLAMPGLTAWGAALIIKSFVIDVIIAHNAQTMLSGAAFSVALTAAALSSFAFAGAMFIAAAQSGWNGYKSWRKIDAEYLLTDRKEKLQSLNAEYQENTITLETIATRINALQQNPILILEEHRAAHPENYEDDDFFDEDFQYDENTAEKEAETERISLHEQAEELKERQAYLHHIKPRLEKQITALQAPDSLLKYYLRAKQQHKAGQRLLDTTAWMFAGVGAVCGGLALLFPPAAIGLGLVCAGCYAIAAGIKIKQLWDKHKANKLREQVFTALERSGDVESLLLRDYFSTFNPLGREISWQELENIKAGLSANDVELIVNWECEKVAKELMAQRAQPKASCWSFFKSNDAVRLNTVNADEESLLLPLGP